VTLRDLDPSDDRPVYRRIADALRQVLESGELAPGDKVPSESELMSRYGVAGGTVRQAIGVLRGGPRWRQRGCRDGGTGWP
jgi:GntR family transcriptional regulator